MYIERERARKRACEREIKRENACERICSDQRQEKGGRKKRGNQSTENEPVCTEM